MPMSWQMRGHDKPHYERSLPVPVDRQFHGKPHRLLSPRIYAAGRMEQHGCRAAIRGVDSFSKRESTKYAGCCKNNRLPASSASFPLVKPGANTIAVRVIKWSDGSSLEDQDMWWLSGISAMSIC